MTIYSDAALQEVLGGAKGLFVQDSQGRAPLLAIKCGCDVAGTPGVIAENAGAAIGTNGPAAPGLH